MMEKFENFNDCLNFIEEFINVYENKPVKDNAGGMDFNHSFVTYYILKKLNPKLVIESGVWKGHSTYIIESALPNCKIVSLDIKFGNLVYKSKNALYFETDFKNVDWSEFGDLKESICFFDDHQNSLERLKEMKWWGFKNAIFEDNFPVGEGDFYSIKQVIQEAGHPNIQMSTNYQPKSIKDKFIRNFEEKILNKFYYRQNMIVKPNSIDNAGLNFNLKNIVEFPPIITDKISYWGYHWKNNYKKADNLINEYNISNFPKLKNFYNKNKDQFTYGYITFIELT